MSLQEQVTRVIDGDTFVTEHRIVRIANVDTPEKGERDFNTATGHLKALLLGEIVTLDEVAHDVYGRMVAHVYVDDIPIGPVVKLMSHRPELRAKCGSSLQASVGNQCHNRKDDVIWLKTALMKLQRYDFSNQPHAYIDRELDRAIKAFQNDQGLMQDGKLLPDGETEQALQAELIAATSA